MADDYVDVLFDGPAGPESGRFVECEYPAGTSVNAGEWIEDETPGWWRLRIPTYRAEHDRVHAAVKAQAEDEGLWFDARLATEAYLQQELRALHALIETGRATPGSQLEESLGG